LRRLGNPERIHDSVYLVFAGFAPRRIGPSFTARWSALGYAKACTWARTSGLGFDDSSERTMRLGLIDPHLSEARRRMGAVRQGSVPGARRTKAPPGPARDVACSRLSPLIEQGRARLSPATSPGLPALALVPAIYLLSQHFSTPRPVPQVTIFVTPGQTPRVPSEQMVDHSATWTTSRGLAQLAQPAPVHHGRPTSAPGARHRRRRQRA
jgi:hypothetical protein